jgi:hypothetical protein
MKRGNLGVFAGLGLAWGVAAVPTPAHAVYEFLTAIPVQPSGSNPLGGQFTTYDISFFDPTTQLDYVADRTNGVVDVFSAATNTFVGRIGTFQGIQPTPPANPALNAISGPDGVVVASLPGQHQLWVGDGNSTLTGFNLPSNTTILGTPISTVLPIPGQTPATAKRVDEGAFDPKDNRLVFANNAASPTPYITVVDAATNAVLHQNVFDGTNGAPNTGGGGGIEQSAWDKVTQKFYLSVDTAAGPGGIAQLDSNGNVTHFFDLSSAAFLGAGGTCGPTGLAVSNIGGGTQLTLACGGQSLIFDPSANGGAGKILAKFNQVTGGDDLNNIQIIQTLATGPGAHSVAVDPISNEIFVPVGGFTAYPTGAGGWGTSPGSAAACGDNEGCVLVFADVPEPASLPVLIVGLAGLFALGMRRAQRST